MKQTLLLWAMGLFGIHSFGGEVITESGKEGADNFNGWYIHPFTLFSSMEFQENYVEFVSEEGGEISIELMRKLPAMSDFSELLVEFQFAEVLNSRLNTITIFASEDGLHWESIPQDATYRAVQFANPEHSYQYLKAIADVTFFSNGRVRWNYTKVEGVEEDESTPSVAHAPVSKASDEFTIFGHDKSINVITPTDKPYRLMVTNMSGQIVHYDKLEGEHKIDTNFPDGVYIVHILRDDVIIAKRKIVL